MINHKSGDGVMSPPTAVTVVADHSSKKKANGSSKPSSSSIVLSPYVTLKRFTSATSDVFDEAKDQEGDYEQREELIDRIKPIKKSSPLSKPRNQSNLGIESFEENPKHFLPQAQENSRLDFISSEKSAKVSPSKGLQNINDLVGNILTKSETISSASDESELMIHEQMPTSPVISMRKTLNSHSIIVPKIVKMSSLSPQTIQLLQKCVERGYMSIQCKDDFHPYDSHQNQKNNSELLITLVESQKTRQGVSLCKRTLTYLKVTDELLTILFRKLIFITSLSASDLIGLLMLPVG
jgi:hypothetical protein